MERKLSALLVGFLFALGLGIAGMTQPENVIGFLDLFGDWNPRLLFVMAGAVGVHFIFYRLIRKRNSPLFSAEWHIPNRKELTPSLIFGALIFGAGWGLAGYCPGPALTSLASFESQPYLFVASMLIGMLLFRFVDKFLKMQK